MTTLTQRYADWMARHSIDNPATPAATVLALRDGDDGHEVLMVQRNEKGAFASNWVFPGGKVDADDFDEDGDILQASRTAACREAAEEADLIVDAASLVPFSHWMPPSVAPRRFATWFYAVAAPSGADGDVTIDGGEIIDHLWVRPRAALDLHRSGKVELVPPTWVTLTHLAEFTDTAHALAELARREPFFYLTKMIKSEPPTLIWHGDAAYETDDLEAPGSRHRLILDPGNWMFEEPSRPH